MERFIISEEKLLHYISNRKSIEAIASMEGTSVPTIYIRVGRIDKTLVRQAKREAKEKDAVEIFELRKAGKSIQEVSSTMHMSIPTIRNRIKLLNKTLKDKLEEIENQENQEKQKAKQQKEEMMRKEIKKLREDDNSVKEVAKMYGVAPTTIYRIAQKTDKTIEKEKAKQTKPRKPKSIIDVSDEELLIDIRNGLYQKEMADARGVSEAYMSTKIAQIDKDKLEEARLEADKKRMQALIEEQNEIKNLKGQGVKICEIAKMKGVSPATINRRLNKSIEIPQNNAIEENQDVSRTRINTKIMQQKMKEKQVTKEDVIAYRKFIDNKYEKMTLQDIMVLVNSYIKTKQIAEAIRFLNTIIHDENLQCLNIERIRQMKKEVEHIEKRQIIRKLCRSENGIKVSDIAKRTGLQEVEILQIKKELGNVSIPQGIEPR